MTYRTTKRADRLEDMPYHSICATSTDSPFAVKPACGKPARERVLEDFDPALVLSTRPERDGPNFYAGSSDSMGGAEVSWMSVAGYGSTEEAARASLWAQLISDRDGKSKFGVHAPLHGYDWTCKLAPYWDLLERETLIREPFKRTVYLGKIKSGRANPKGFDVFVDIEWTGVRLSLSGVVGPKSNGNAWGGCGQILEDIQRKDFLEFAPGWQYSSVLDGLRQAWTRWHLNDMRAGSPRQEAHLRSAKAQATIAAAKAMSAHYLDATRDELARYGLEPDQAHQPAGKPYSYGSAWNHEDVPTLVLDFLRNLPAPIKTSPWR